MTKPIKKEKAPLWTEIVGWYGALAILFAYGAVSFEWISPEGVAFQLLNLTGAIGLIVIALRKSLHQAVFLNAVWVAIAVVALLGIVL